MEERQPLQVLIEDRKRRGMTPAEYARFLEQPKPTVHRWETGERKIGPKKLLSIAEKTGISPRELRPDWAETLEPAEAIE